MSETQHTFLNRDAASECRDGPRRTLKTYSSWAHDCAFCRQGACFGFADRRYGTVWTCMAHRDQGRAQTKR